MSTTTAIRSGRPRYDRAELLLLLWRSPRRGRNLVRVNERELGRKLGWSRDTVGRAIVELEAEGLVQRVRRLGHQGLTAKLLGDDPRNA